MELRFVCDAMLGTLARWLRFAGFDVVYSPKLDDDSLSALARAEGRWLLTQDRGLAAKAGPRVLLVPRGGLPEQVAALRQRLPLQADPALFFSRCSRCNGKLVSASREQVKALVPPFVAVHGERFVRCLSCGRVYWRGTHTPRIAATLRKLFVET